MSLNELAITTGLSTETVRRVLKGLVKANLLLWREHNRYDLNFGAPFLRMCYRHWPLDT